ncbi:hypothetical protein [Rosenbergiella epipactidis]|uniref:hypothetical protein n=1 Tax=Rosenbergiella epipactidis TaxID=1544694 RepID=UPI001F4EEDF3|nr:hypothetical protein [Rosenbergiella epipactidis]
MDNNIEKNTGSTTKKRYFILGRPAGPLLIALIFIYTFIYFLYTPLYFAYVAKFPEKDEIHYSEGLFTFRPLDRQRFQFGLITPAKTEFFSCKSIHFSSHICEVNRIHFEQINEELGNKGKFSRKDPTPVLYKRWQGKPARIAWFNQRYNLFSTERRIVQIIIDGKEVLSNERVIDSINYQKDKWYFITFIVVSSPLIFLIALLSKRIILNQNLVDGEPLVDGERNTKN